MRIRLPWLCSPWMAWPTMALLAAIGTSVVYFVDPSIAGRYPPCPFLFFTSCYCPGCGTLRALHRLLHGDIRSALGYNPLFVLTLPSAAVAGMDQAFARKPVRRFGVDHRLAWGLLAVIVLFWALRNIPVYPLTILAP